MAISPNDAARFNDAAIEEFKKLEQTRIDQILCQTYYTGGPPVEVEPTKHDIEGVVRDIMRLYTEAGWRIEVITRQIPKGGTKQFWNFHKNTK